MQRALRARFALAALGALSLAKRDARADAKTEPLRLSWIRPETAAACPDSRVVEDRVRSRLGRDPFREDAPTAAEVLVERSDDEFIARMRVLGPDGTLAGQRTLRSSESCDTLASAVALALALYVDPDAALGPPPPPAPVSLPLVPSATEVVPLIPIAVEHPPQKAPPRSAPSAPPEHPRGAALAAGVLVAPSLVPGTGWASWVEADLEPAPRWHLRGRGLFAPEERTSDGNFAFGVAAMGPGACFDAFSRDRLRIAPCVTAWVGEIHAIVLPHMLETLPPGGRFWASADATVRLRVRLLSILFVDAEAGVMAPFVRYGFAVVGQSPTVFQEWIAIPVVSLGLALSFP
jgi:hypothetical protein